jgi:hypothetical protein
MFTGLSIPKPGAPNGCFCPGLMLIGSTPQEQNLLAVSGQVQRTRIVLVLDNAGWHRSEKVVVPEGIDLLFVPPYSAELQPAERLWELVDEPLVNRSFDTLEQLKAILVKRCQTLSTMTTQVQERTQFYWWTVT